VTSAEQPSSALRDETERELACTRGSALDKTSRKHAAPHEEDHYGEERKERVEDTSETNKRGPYEDPPNSRSRVGAVGKKCATIDGARDR